MHNCSCHWIYFISYHQSFVTNNQIKSIFFLKISLILNCVHSDSVFFFILCYECVSASLLMFIAILESYRFQWFFSWSWWFHLKFTILCHGQKLVSKYLIHKKEIMLQKLNISLKFLILIKCFRRLSKHWWVFNRTNRLNHYATKITD